MAIRRSSPPASSRPLEPWGQIIPPSIVIVLLGTLAGDLYSRAQEVRAQSLGCTDALTYLGEPAVVSVGTLFQAALLPGILLAGLYAGYAFVYALINPSKAPAVQTSGGSGDSIGRNHALQWFLAAPIALIGGAILLGQANIIGSQDISVSSRSELSQGASLRTNVGPECQAAMIELHGQEAWDLAISEQQAIADAGGVVESRALSDQEIEDKISQRGRGCSPHWARDCDRFDPGDTVPEHSARRGAAAGLQAAGHRLCRGGVSTAVRYRFDQSTHIGGPHLNPYVAAHGVDILWAAQCGGASGGK